MFWLGDQLTSWDACDGLQSAMIGAMSGGLSGWTINHVDIGGFTMIDRGAWLPGSSDIHFGRDSELLVRWMELAVFLNAVYRSHPGLILNGTAQPWDTDVLAHTLLLTRLFQALTPYRQSLFREAEQKGVPPVRHGVLVHPEDAAWFNASTGAGFDEQGSCARGGEVGLQQFFMGDDLLVAPVLRNGSRNVSVYLPSGDWVHFWSNVTTSGPLYSSWSAPLGYPAFFYRTGTNWTSFFRETSRQLKTLH